MTQHSGQDALLEQWVRLCDSNTRPGTGSAGSLRYDDYTLYSYATPIAVHVTNAEGDRAFYVTTTKYSRTTTTQVGKLIHALTRAGYFSRIFYFEYVAEGGRNPRGLGTTPNARMAEIVQMLSEAAGRIVKRGRAQDMQVQEVERLIHVARKFSTFWSVDCKVDSYTYQNLISLGVSFPD